MAKLKTGRHTSAIKVARRAARRRWANRAQTDEVRVLTKRLQEAVAKKDAAQTKELFPQVVSLWQRLGRKNLVHHATASRKIGRLSRSVHKLLAAS